MSNLWKEIRSCELCADTLTPNPVIAIHPKAKLVIIGQAPGTKVHDSGIPWNDASGILLRKWLGMENADFYDETKVAIVPMGFCYPGKGKTGDLPPKKICATTWHQRVLESLPEARLLLLIGSYAQKYYLKDVGGKTLTENVGNFEQFLPTYFPLPHPSPRNRFWMQKNKWFETEVLPELRKQIREVL